MNAKITKLFFALSLAVLAFQPYLFARADTSDASTPVTDRCTAELCVEPKIEADGNPLKFRMGERLKIKITGKTASLIKEDIKTRRVEDVLSLYLDGTRIADIPVGVVSSNDSEVLIYFDLIRDASKEKNREAWNTIFKQHSYEMKLKPGLSIDGGLPLVISPGSNFEFYVATQNWVWSMLVICLLMFFLSFYLLTKTKAFRDGSHTSFYSLGKSQMAFWGLLVVLAFVGVWVVNGTMEEIPEQMLMLLGISGVTGLGAVVISESKNSTKLQKISALQTEQKEIINKQADSSATAKDLARLEQIPSEIDTLNASVTESTGSFWRDICDDGNGLSFHRLQVVIWTLVLGTIFVVSVVQLMSMPQFPGSLLILMGVSNVTYLGFKIPEK